MTLNEKHEVVIIGGSLAGAACARELTRLGVDAVALERDRFPRRKVCGGFLSPGAVACVERLGLLEEVRAAGAVEVKSARVRVDSADVEIPFDRPGLGISRIRLDEIIAHGTRVQEGCPVRDVKREGRRFVVDGIECSVVIDAAGKLSRFTRRQSIEEFGIQHAEAAPRGSVLDFWFFEDGYGGGVSVEGGRSNFCFLVKKEALPKYLKRGDCMVTGPLAYSRLPGEFIAIGDAAGMVDPFCGEGMRHAMESGMLAAQVVAAGIRTRSSYEQIKLQYESRWERQWAARRAMGAALRRILRHRRLLGTGMRIAPTSLLNCLWR
jgi:flavin-dependent dehydrogenase